MPLQNVFSDQTSVPQNFFPEENHAICISTRLFCTKRLHSRQLHNLSQVKFSNSFHSRAKACLLLFFKTDLCTTGRLSTWWKSFNIGLALLVSTALFFWPKPWLLFSNTMLLWSMDLRPKAVVLYNFLLFMVLTPIALGMAKIPLSFGHSECNRVKKSK